ncbi:MAG: gliding motility-associated-like protein, partial [Saprospiraceae bacterium]
TVYNQDTPEGTEYIDVSNEEGCDSIINVQLEFYPKSEKVIIETISQGSSIEFAGTTYDSTGIYETILVGQAYTGCDSITRLDLTVVPQDVILSQDFPNAFTPNGDGLNDQFVIPTLQSQPGNFPNNEFLIFSRGSQILYQSQPYNNDWDGKSSEGQELPTGTYYYVFRYEDNGGEVVKKGKILLMR